MSNPDAGSTKVQNVAHTFSILENLDMYRLWLRTAAVFPSYIFFLLMVLEIHSDLHTFGIKPSTLSKLMLSV